ncbi:hypothetical protein ACLQ28_03810 [Micromonospora sp. DT201]|uniref:hypothetical protein n=1 Tax=Micromonospora sp. DT201 TaxID=3393442 RepID=UPI003CEAEBDE
MKVDFSASDFEKNRGRKEEVAVVELGDLLDRHAWLAVTGHPHDVIAKLSWLGLGHNDILPARHQGAPSQMSPIGAAGPL